MTVSVWSGAIPSASKDSATYIALQEAENLYPQTKDDLMSTLRVANKERK
jgi:hypothetical protein